MGHRLILLHQILHSPEAPAHAQFNLTPPPHAFPATHPYIPVDDYNPWPIAANERDFTTVWLRTANSSEIQYASTTVSELAEMFSCMSLDDSTPYLNDRAHGAAPQVGFAVHAPRAPLPAFIPSGQSSSSRAQQSPPQYTLPFPLQHATSPRGLDLHTDRAPISGERSVLRQPRRKLAPLPKRSPPKSASRVQRHSTGTWDFIHSTPRKTRKLSRKSSFSSISSSYSSDSSDSSESAYPSSSSEYSSSTYSPAPSVGPETPPSSPPHHLAELSSPSIDFASKAISQMVVAHEPSSPWTAFDDTISLDGFLSGEDISLDSLIPDLKSSIADFSS